MLRKSKENSQSVYLIIETASTLSVADTWTSWLWNLKDLVMCYKIIFNIVKLEFSDLFYF